jgi:hypothetical protein
MDNMDSYLAEYRRKVKSLSENIILQGVVAETDCSRFLIYSSSKNCYYITTRDTEYNGIHIECTCPDFKRRNKYCKHIYWLGIKQLHKENPFEWTANDIQQFLKEYYLLYGYSHWSYPAGIIYGKNDNCPICLEPIDYENDFTLCCQNRCQNSVHVLCWNKYQEISQSYKCVICRGPLI